MRSVSRSLLFGTLLLLCSCWANAGQRGGTTPGSSSAWTLVWADEFNTPGLPDSTKWTYDVGGHGWGNKELQFYTRARLENARVEQGRLIIEARREGWEGKEYTSARLV